MDFRKATDELCVPITHEDIARQLRVSVQSIRQARLRDDAPGHRSPPDNWQTALAELAEKRIVEYRELADQLRDGARE
jgi:hypothetical protein